MPTGGQKHPPRVTIYTTPQCHWCNVARAYFSDNDIPYRQVDVSSRGVGRREMTLLTGGSTVPVIVVGEHAMTGWDEAEFRRLMEGTFKRR